MPPKSKTKPNPRKKPKANIGGAGFLWPKEEKKKSPRKKR